MHLTASHSWAVIASADKDWAKGIQLIEKDVSIVLTSVKGCQINKGGFAADRSKQTNIRRLLGIPWVYICLSHLGNMKNSQNSST